MTILIRHTQSENEPDAIRCRNCAYWRNIECKKGNVNLEVIDDDKHWYLKTSCTDFESWHSIMAKNLIAIAQEMNPEDPNDFLEYIFTEKLKS